jgi:hypothetical protein
MNIRTFWTLFLKILGIWLILSGLTVIPQFISAFAYFGDNHQDNFFAAIYIIVILLLTIGLYFVVLKFQEEKIDLNITLKTVLTIATIVIGGLILVDALPMLCKQIFTFMQQKSVFREDPQFSWIIFYSIKALIGYLLMTNSKMVINYIDKSTENVEK